MSKGRISSIKSKAFAPANISCIFKIYSHKNPRWMGSYGLGFTLNDGVIVDASKNESTEILFNHKKIYIPTVKKVIDFLTYENVKINIKSSLPLGCGFGLSGASALATSYALNKLLNLGRSNKDLAVIAHIAEVESKTGLGDVVNQYYGGMLAKFKPSSYFIVNKIPLNNTPVYCEYFSKLSTKSIISNTQLKDRINQSASLTLNKLQKLLKINKKPSFKDIINLSKEFAINSGLLKNKNVKNTVENIEKNNGNGSMIMLGNSVFSDKFFDGSIKFTISNKGAQLI